MKTPTENPLEDNFDKYSHHSFGIILATVDKLHPGVKDRVTNILQANNSHYGGRGMGGGHPFTPVERFFRDTNRRITLSVYRSELTLFSPKEGESVAINVPRKDSASITCSLPEVKTETGFTTNQSATVTFIFKEGLENTEATVEEAAEIISNSVLAQLLATFCEGFTAST